MSALADACPVQAKVAGATRQQIEAAVEKTPFAAWAGVKIIDYSEGHASLSVPCRADMLMHQGFVHGAIVGFVADSACAWAAASVVGEVVTSEYKLNLLAPAVGSELIGIGEVIKASSRQVVCRADVFSVVNAERRLVATALATISRLR